MKGLQALQAALIIAFLCSLGQARHIIQTKLENAKSKRETCPIQCGFMFEANQNFIRSLKKIHQPGKKNNAKAPKMELYRMVVFDDVCSIHYIFYRAIGFKKKLAETSWRSKAMAAQKIAHFTRGGCQNLQTE